MKGACDRRDPERSLPAVVCPVRLANSSTPMGRSVPRMLVETRADSQAVLPAMRYAGTSDRGLVRRLPPRRPRL